MNVQQILVKSNSRSDSTKNEIVAMSGGISKAIADQAAKWATKRSCLFPKRSTATFFFKTDCGNFILGRSFIGPADSTGDRALYSKMVVLTEIQLAAYQHNPVLVARVLNSFGDWMLDARELGQGAQELAEIELPETCVNVFEAQPPCENSETIQRALALHEKIGLQGGEDQLAYIGRFLNSQPKLQRGAISFSVGRNVSPETPFRVSFFPGDDKHWEREMLGQQVYPVRIKTAANVAAV